LNDVQEAKRNQAAQATQSHRRQIRISRAKEYLADAKQLRESGDYPAALDKIAQAEGLNVKMDDLDTMKKVIVNGYRKATLDSLDDHVSQGDYNRAIQITEQYLQKVGADTVIQEKRDQLNREQVEIEGLLKESQVALDEKRYKDSLDFANQVLKRLPGNDEARELAVKARGKPPVVKLEKLDKGVEEKEYEIEGTVTSDRPLSQVECRYWFNDEKDKTRTVSVNVRNGKFVVEISDDEMIAGKLTFDIVARDTVENTTVKNDSVEVNKKRKVAFGAF
jgi:hypothetical protein